MPHRSDETLFTAFRERRDCQALSVLFHRHAEELLRIAMFLAPRPCDAEDLVQATFLSAIARAETYRSEHRVMSWLCGILTNHARMLRRAERRQPLTAHDDVAEDPAHTALHSELRHALTRAIAELPEPYRAVLTLHLENGLDSHEISQRLARPAATVRKQMERALDRLRVALPTGLATGLLAGLTPAQLADRATDTARCVEPLPRSAVRPRHPAATWLAAAAMGTVAVLLTPLLALAPASPTLAGTTATAALPPAAAVAAPAAATSQPNDPPPNRATATAVGTLTVTATGSDGTARSGIDVWLVPDDGRPLPPRLLGASARRASTDANGIATFADLAPGPHDVTVAGAVVRTKVRIGTAPTECRLEVAAPVPCHGVVVDAAGQPLAEAEIWASETTGRGDLGQLVATSGADGSFAGSTTLTTSRVFARHARCVQSHGVRFEPDRSLRLQLETARRTIRITTRTADGQALADCYVAIAPRSNGLSLHAPLHGCTDSRGSCVLADPGQRQATVLASHPGFAATCVDLGPDDTSVDVVLTAGARVRGRALAADGSPLAHRDVTFAPWTLRSNEPTAPLLALQARTGRDGDFVFDHLPIGPAHLRMLADGSPSLGRPPAPYVLAATDLELAAGATTDVELRARRDTRLRGVLRAPTGAPIANWNVMAVPALGTATHRQFGLRGATTSADGTFQIAGLTTGESYQLGVFPPGSPRRGEQTLPLATGLATAGADDVPLVVDPTHPPGSRLRCRVLGPGGKPLPGAELELRAAAFQSPTTRTAAADGSAVFGPLAPGEYWLALLAPGLGTRTQVVRIAAADQDVDLGTVELQPAARLMVRLFGAAAGANHTVVAQNTLGDKFVSATTDARGIATLPPLPPGETRLLVHGRGIAPLQHVVTARSGPQLVELEPTAATPVELTFPFAPADNPFVVNGPLHVRVSSATGEPVLEDYVGAASEPGRFELVTGLRPGRYRIVARALWGARGELDLDVTDAPGARVTLPLRGND